MLSVEGHKPENIMLATSRIASRELETTDQRDTRDFCGFTSEVVEEELQELKNGSVAASLRKEGYDPDLMEEADWEMALRTRFGEQFEARLRSECEPDGALQQWILEAYALIPKVAGNQAIVNTYFQPRIDELVTKRKRVRLNHQEESELSSLRIGRRDYLYPIVHWQQSTMKMMQRMGQLERGAEKPLLRQFWQQWQEISGLWISLEDRRGIRRGLAANVIFGETLEQAGYDGYLPPVAWDVDNGVDLICYQKTDTGFARPSFVQLKGKREGNGVNLAIGDVGEIGRRNVHMLDLEASAFLSSCQECGKLLDASEVRSYWVVLNGLSAEGHNVDLVSGRVRDPDQQKRLVTTLKYSWEGGR